MIMANSHSGFTTAALSTKQCCDNTAQVGFVQTAVLHLYSRTTELTERGQYDTSASQQCMTEGTERARLSSCPECYRSTCSLCLHVRRTQNHELTIPATLTFIRGT